MKGRSSLLQCLYISNYKAKLKTDFPFPNRQYRQFFTNKRLTFVVVGLTREDAYKEEKQGCNWVMVRNLSNRSPVRLAVVLRTTWRDLSCFRTAYFRACF